MTRIEHLLTIVSEECAEVSQRCSKALRFGLNEIQPGQPLTNAARIYQEYADLRAAMELLQAHCEFMTNGLPSLEAMVDSKHRKVADFLKHSALCGTLSDPVAAEIAPDGYEGWICGNNYRKRGRVMPRVGKEGEPWYIADDGMKWSAFDVTFLLDPIRETPTKVTQGLVNALKPFAMAYGRMVEGNITPFIRHDDLRNAREAIRLWELAVNGKKL